MACRHVPLFLRSLRANRAYDGSLMAKPRRPVPDPDQSVVLDPTSAGKLRIAVDRLRADGMTPNQAAGEMLREKIYGWAESESDNEGTLPRLRLVTRRD